MGVDKNTATGFFTLYAFTVCRLQRRLDSESGSVS